MTVRVSPRVRIAALGAFNFGAVLVVLLGAAASLRI